MDRLELALRGYQRITPDPRFGADEAASDQLEAWLREQVVPVVEDLQLKSPRFRGAVLSGLEKYAPDAVSPQRQQIDRVDRALSTCAAVVVHIAHEAGLSAALAAGASNRPISGVDMAAAAQPEPQFCWWVVEQAAKRPWRDLVCPEDFFIPSGELCLKEPDGRLSVEFNRRRLGQFSFGDHMTRMLFARVDFWKQFIEEAHGQCYSAAITPQAPFAWTEQLLSAQIELNEAVRGLRETCESEDEPRLQNACCALVQVFVAYHPHPAMSWLPLPKRSVETSGAIIRSLVRHPGEAVLAQRTASGQLQVVRQGQASLVDLQRTEEVVAALNDVAELYRRSAPPDELIEETVKNHQLVVVENPRMAFWRGEKLAVNWDNHLKCWELLLKLASGAMQSAGVDHFGLGSKASARTLSVRKYNLSKLLPEGLAALIDKEKGGPCCLRVEPSDVMVLRLEADAWSVDPGEFA